MRLSARLAAICGCILVLAWTGCDQFASSGTVGSGGLKLLITDKPFPFEFITSAVVTLTRVEVRQAEPASQPATQPDDEDSGQDDATDDDGTFITVFEDAAGKSFDLIDLRDGRTDLLADATLPVGTYTQMRLVVTGGEVTLTDGRTFPLTVPSGAQSGIKLNFTFEVSADEQTVLLLDVDLSRAFTPIPGGKIDHVSSIRQFHFSPSVAMRLIKLLEAGAVSGTVTDESQQPLAGVSVTAIKDGEELTSTATLADGSYTLAGLATGTYRIEFSLSGYEDVSVGDISVTAGQETAGVDAVLTQESSGQ